MYDEIKRFETRANKLNNIDEFLSFRWFNMSNVFEQNVGKRCEKLPVRSVVYFVLYSCACLNFAARSRRKLRPISGDMWFTAIVSIGERQGLHRTPSWLFSRRCFFPNSFYWRTCATSPLRIGSGKSVPFEEQPGFCASVWILYIRSISLWVMWLPA